MKIQQIYELAVKLGMQSDLRGLAKVKKILQKNKEKYEKLSGDKKKEFDQESLVNPYSDSRVFIDHGREVKKILVGIDPGPAEVLIARDINADLIISHHPIGSALADLGDVMHLQADVLAMYGVPINIAESLTRERISEVARGVAVANHYRTVDAAKIYNMGIMCTHTVTDNLVAEFLDKLIKKAKPETVGEVMDLLKTIPEYQQATKQKNGPFILVGDLERSAGKIVVTEITGGTEGAVGIYEKMAQAGIGTIVGMHMNEERKKEAQKNHVNVIIAGHMSSDSLGLNLFMDELQKRGIEVIPCSGFIRYSRLNFNKKPAAKAAKKKAAKKASPARKRR